MRIERGFGVQTVDWETVATYTLLLAAGPVYIVYTRLLHGTLRNRMMNDFEFVVLDRRPSVVILDSTPWFLECVPDLLFFLFFFYLFSFLLRVQGSSAVDIYCWLAGLFCDVSNERKRLMELGATNVMVRVYSVFVGLWRKKETHTHTVGFTHGEEKIRKKK